MGAPFGLCRPVKNSPTIKMGVCMSIDEHTLQIHCGADVRARHRGRKRIIMELLNAEAKAYQLLSHMPGRICANGVANSSCIFTKQGRKGINQDCMLVWEGFAAQSNTLLCAVFDGHGPNGHLVSRKVRDSLPCLLAFPLDSLLNADTAAQPSTYRDGGSRNFAEDEHEVEISTESEVFAMWKDKFVQAYKLMDLNLKTHPKINCSCSGTTAVTMILQDKELVVAHVGDSRAILARRADDGSLISDQLTIDLKPNLPGELERIRSCKGRVFALEDEPQVARVWLPHANTPGLAMARSLGDFCLKDYGLSSIPEVFYRKLTEEDELIILATDGVWDVLSNDEAVAIVSSAFPKETAAKCLVKAAVKNWKKKHPDVRTDDCAVVCHFLRDKLTPSSTWNARAKAVDDSADMVSEDASEDEIEPHVWVWP